MKPSLLRRVVPVLVLLLAAPCLGWGADGHRIVGEIASHHLTPEARAGVQVLLGDQSLADVGTWADEVRSQPEYQWTRPLHYANVKPEGTEFDLNRDCPEEGCVVSAIIRFTEVLQDTEASTAEKTEALNFLVHFVGDVHQPLHVSRARDRGGNDIKVEFFHDRTNLHRVWDSGLIRRTKKPWKEYAEELRESITQEQIAAWKSRDPVEWATESYKLALSHAYEVPEDGQLGQAYFERCIPVVEQRLAMAGVRLAELLNQVFAESTGATETPASSSPVQQP